MTINKIAYTPTFKRDVKKLKKAHYNLDLMYEAIDHIIKNNSDILKSRYRDHALKGNWQGYRELHIQGDWLLIYKLEKDQISLTTILTRTGSHDKLF